MPQGMPVQAAHGGSIDHLVSNLGQYYNGGGIVAFNGEGDSDVPTPKRKLRQYTLQEQGADYEAQRQAARDAAAQAPPPEAGYDGPEYASVWQATKRAREAAARKRLEEERARNMAQVNAQPGEMRPVMQNDPRLMGVTPSAETVGALAVAPPPQALAAAAAAAAQKQKQQSTPRPPPAANPPAPPAAAAANLGTSPIDLAANDLNSVLRQDVMNTLKRDPDKERDKGADYYRQTVGLDALLADQETRTAAREARYKEAQANRTPDWVRGLQAASGPAVRGGLGMLLGQVGRGATSSRDANAAADAKFADDQDRLRDIITKAKIEGNTNVANAGVKALSELRMDHQNARTTGASLLTNEESAKQRAQSTADATAQKAQAAKDALAGRLQTDKHRREDRATATADKADADFRMLAMRLATKAATDAKADLRNSNKYKDMSIEELAASKFDAIYKALKTGKMGAAPDAGSPGGTPADVAALLQKYGGK
jgi:hypothetical protein